jgi:hypothetical protein
LVPFKPCKTTSYVTLFINVMPMLAPNPDYSNVFQMFRDLIFKAIIK